MDDIHITTKSPRRNLSISRGTEREREERSGEPLYEPKWRTKKGEGRGGDGHLSQRIRTLRDDEDEDEDPGHPSTFDSTQNAIGMLLKQA